MKEFVRVMKALSDPNRVKMLKLLQGRELCVCELTAALKIAQPTASNHLKVLENAGLVQSAKQGQWVIYSLSQGDTPYARSMLKELRGWLEDAREIQDLLSGLDSLDREKLCLARPSRTSAKKREPQ